MKPNRITVTLASLLAACSPETGGGNGIVKPMPDSGPGTPPISRLYVDSFGSIFDRALDNQECAWMLTTPSCAKICLPVEPTFPACDSKGLRYYYTRQGLTTVYKYGRISTIEDPECSGQTTNQLVELTILNPLDKANITMPQSCTKPSGGLELSLYDRQWYTVILSTLTAATPADLPSSGPK